MKKNPYLLLSALFVFLLTVMILLFPSLCLFFALNGLNLWFQKMIPALFPFMVLSGIMIRMDLTDTFVTILSPVLKPLFRVSPACLYTIVIGFLCGFPMGANVTAQLYERGKLTRPEANYLLAFCNNIGPVYFLSFALPAIGIRHVLPALFGMYGLPLLYGMFLSFFLQKKTQHETLPSLKSAETKKPVSFLEALDDSVLASLTSITKLGGYMILFNMLNVFPALFCKNQTVKALFNCLLEITGGISAIQSRSPFLVLCLLHFGGLSCIAQTYSMIKNTDLSLKNYLFHKLMLTAVSSVYYAFFLKISFLP